MATRYSYPIDLHEERGRRLLGHFPRLRRGVHGRRTHSPRRSRKPRTAWRKRSRGRIAAAGGNPDAEPGQGAGPRQFPARSWPPRTALYEAPARRAAVPTAASPRPWAFRRARFRRMLDPRHTTKIGRLEQALARFKKRPGGHRGRSRLRIDRRWAGVFFFGAGLIPPPLSRGPAPWYSHPGIGRSSSHRIFIGRSDSWLR